MPEAVEAPITELNNDAIASIAEQSIKEALGASDERAATEEKARNEKGQFVAQKKEGEEVVADAPTVIDPEQPDVEKAPEVVEEVKLPEGMVAVPKVEGRELATSFKMLDKDGELEVPDLTIEFVANGKTRKEPLDKVVKLAQFGVYNHEREQAVQKSQEDARAVQEQSRQVIDYAKQLESKMNAMLENPDLYMQELKTFEARNTPEARAKAIDEREREFEQRTQFQQKAQTGQRFAEQEITPAVETIRKALPTVSEEEIGAKLLLITNQHLEHTPFGPIVPPSAYPAIRKAVIEQVVPWAQQLHESRDHDAKQQRQEAEKAKTTAQAEAQKAKNLVGKAIKPSANATKPGSKEKPAPKPIKTLEDAEKSVLEETYAAMGMN